MGKHRIDGPGMVGFIAAATIILTLALALYTILPKTAQAQGVDEELTIKKSAIVELGSKYLESIADRNKLLDALDEASKEIRRLQSATNCS